MQTKEEINRENMQICKYMGITPYPKFYSMKFPSIEIETKINLIAVEEMKTV